MFSAGSCPCYICKEKLLVVPCFSGLACSNRINTGKNISRPFSDNPQRFGFPSIFSGPKDSWCYPYTTGTGHVVSTAGCLDLSYLLCITLRGCVPSCNCFPTPRYHYATSKGISFKNINVLYSSSRCMCINIYKAMTKSLG